MIFRSNIAFPEDSELLVGMEHSYLMDRVALYKNRDSDKIAYLMIEVKHMLNLLYESEGETIDEIFSFGKIILQTAEITKNHCQTDERERALVHSICIQDNVPSIDFNLTNALVCGQNGCILYHDAINNTWAIYIDGIQFHCFRHERNARRIFEYMKRDIRQSSEKWMSIVDGISTRF